MPFTRKKRLFWGENESIGGRPPPLNPPLPSFLSWVLGGAPAEITVHFNLKIWLLVSHFLDLGSEKWYVGIFHGETQFDP